MAVYAYNRNMQSALSNIIYFKVEDSLLLYSLFKFFRAIFLAIVGPIRHCLY